MLRQLAVAVLLSLPPGGGALAAAPEGASPSDRLIFADRDWSGARQGIDWSLDRAGQVAPGFLPATGQVRVVEVTDPVRGRPILELHEAVDGRDRVIGSFPPSVDPVLVYFLESTTRNMAAIAGGSPDYVRNRIKAALRRGGAVVTAADGGRTVILSPFLDDPNAPRMRGFETLTLVISLAPRQGAPIRGLSAEAPAAGYRLQLVGGQP